MNRRKMRRIHEYNYTTYNNRLLQFVIAHVPISLVIAHVPISLVIAHVPISLVLLVVHIVILTNDVDYLV